MTFSKTLTAAIASTAALAIMPAMAGIQTDVQVRSTTVSIAGYDLTEIADAKTVLAKIEAAAEKVCTIRTNRATAREAALRNACARDAVEKAIQSLDAPQVTALVETQG